MFEDQAIGIVAVDEVIAIVVDLVATKRFGVFFGLAMVKRGTIGVGTIDQSIAVVVEAVLAKVFGIFFGLAVVKRGTIGVVAVG